MLIVAYYARSPQIASAARLLAISWAFSLQIWLAFSESSRVFAYGVLDLTLACAFLEMSRRKWFPVPLFFVHASLFLYVLYTSLIGSSHVWVALFINRGFELAVIYVIACGAYRIHLIRKGDVAP